MNKVGRTSHSIIVLRYKKYMVSPKLAAEAPHQHRLDGIVGLDLLSRIPLTGSRSNLRNLSEDHSGYSRDLLQALFKFVESHNQLVWYEVTLIVATFAT